jgi:hypothetical protein
MKSIFQAKISFLSQEEETSLFPRHTATVVRLEAFGPSFCCSYGEMRLSLLGLRSHKCTLYHLRIIHETNEASGAWELQGETEVFGENLSQSHFVYPTRSDLSLNPVRRGEMTVLTSLRRCDHCDSWEDYLLLLLSQLRRKKLHCAA